MDRDAARGEHWMSSLKSTCAHVDCIKSLSLVFCKSFRPDWMSLQSGAQGFRKLLRFILQAQWVVTPVVGKGEPLPKPVISHKVGVLCGAATGALLHLPRSGLHKQLSNRFATLGTVWPFCRMAGIPWKEHTAPNECSMSSVSIDIVLPP